MILPASRYIDIDKEAVDAIEMECSALAAGLEITFGESIVETFSNAMYKEKKEKPLKMNGKKCYKVDYHGQKNLFDGAKENYLEETEVEIAYSCIATDTDYSFYADGKEVCAEWNDKRGYIIRFTMPDHDIEVFCVEKNSMKK